MARIPRITLCTILALWTALSVANSATGTPPGNEVVAYFEGDLVTVTLERLPDHAARGILDRNDNIGVFFDGLVGVCSPAPDSGVGYQYCLFSWVTPVLASVDGNPVCRPVSIFMDQGSPWQDFTSYSEIEAAAQRGEIDISPTMTVYRCSVRKESTESTAPLSDFESRRKVADQATTWGALKSLHR